MSLADISTIAQQNLAMMLLSGSLPVSWCVDLLVSAVLFLVARRWYYLFLAPRVTEKAADGAAAESTFYPGWLPYFGVVPEFAVDPTKILRTLSTSGKAVSFRLAGLDICLLNDFRQHGFFFTIPDETLSFRDAYVNMFESVLGLDAFSVTVPIKDLFRPGMHPAKYDVFDRLIADEVAAFYARKYVPPSLATNSQQPMVADLFHDFNELILLTTSRCLVGQEVHQDQELMHLLRELEGGFNVVGLFYPGLPLPHLASRRRARDRILSKLRRIVQERRQARESSSADCSDMLAVLLECSQENQLDDSKLAGVLLSFIFVGQVQTYAAAAWAAIFILARPALFAAVKAEIVATGLNRVRDMVLLERCCKESIRLAAPVLMFRKVMKNYRCADYWSKGQDLILRRGSLVAVSPYLVHREASCYPRPEEYLPDRFDPSNGELYRKVPYSYLGFGAGRHACLGEHFAYLEMKHALAQLFIKFDAQLLAEVPKPNFKHIGGLVIPADPCPVALTPVLPSTGAKSKLL